MPKNKEIEITLTLKDEATKKIQSFRSGVKEFNNATKDALQPLLLLRQTWMKAGLAIGLAVGFISKGISEVEKLRKEIDALDISAIKLGVTSRDLSKQIYGFDLTTINARIGTAQMHAVMKNVQDAWNWGISKIAEIGGVVTKGNRAEGIYQAKLRNLGVQEEFGQERGPLWEESKREAEQQLLAEGEARKSRSDEARKINEDLTQKTRQLTLSGLEYKKYALDEELKIFQKTGADKIKLSEYEVAMGKRLEEDRTIALTQQQSLRLKAEGRTLDAIRLEQNSALMEFKRQFGGDGEQVRAFIRGQQAIYRQAQLAYMGIKSEFQIFHDGFVSLVQSMTSTFSDVFYNTITGQMRSLKEVFNSFGQAILKNMSDMLAQYLIMKAVMGIGSLLGIGTPAVAGAGGYGAGTPAGAMNMGTWTKLPTPMAEGGQGIVRRPTLFLAGEGGPEQYQFTPLNKMNQREGGVGETHTHYHSTVVIKAWDFSDIYDNKGAIEGIINESLRRQGSVAKSVKRYR